MISNYPLFNVLRPSVLTYFVTACQVYNLARDPQVLEDLSGAVINKALYYGPSDPEYINRARHYESMKYSPAGF